MLLSDIQQVITPQVWEHIKVPMEGYYLNVHKDFFIEHINNYGDYYHVGLRGKGNIIIPKADNYIDLCQRILNAYHEFIEQGICADTLNKDEHWYCRNCGKEFSHEMNFRQDRYGRNVCPYCESRKLDRVSGAVDSFYD